MAEVTEFDLVARIAALTPHARDDVRLSVGDDGAVLAPPAGYDLVLTADTLVDGVHFPAGTDAAHVGYKSLSVNLSDLAAMGATPAWALLALTLPAPDVAWVEGFAAGFAALAAEYQVALVGGDTNRGPLSITVQAAGFLPAGQALTRRGARPGDEVFVTGTLGDAAAGLAVVQDRLAAGSHAEVLVARLNRPTPRIKAGCALLGLATAAIDVSDGLGADLGHLLAPEGWGAEIELDALPASKALQAVVPASERPAYQFAGDDYELCFTATEENATRIHQTLAAQGCPVTRIGRITERPGLRCLSEGKHTPAPAGWRHFHA